MGCGQVSGRGGEPRHSPTRGDGAVTSSLDSTGIQQCHQTVWTRGALVMSLSGPWFAQIQLGMEVYSNGTTQEKQPNLARACEHFCNLDDDRFHCYAGAVVRSRAWRLQPDLANVSGYL